MKFPWSKKQQMSTQAYRVQLESVMRELRMAVSEVREESSRERLVEDINQLESTYRQELRQL